MNPRKFTVGIMVTPYDHQRLRALADRKGQTLTRLLRRWLNHGLEHDNIELLEPLRTQQKDPA